MIQKLSRAPRLFILAFLAFTTVVWLRNTVVLNQKLPSDRALKRDIQPVTW